MEKLVVKLGVKLVVKLAQAKKKSMLAERVVKRAQVKRKSMLDEKVVHRVAKKKSEQGTRRKARAKSKPDCVVA